MHNTIPTNQVVKPPYWLGIAALNLAAAVMFGAFGAHALKSSLNPEQLNWWQTATQYFFWHGLGLLLFGVILYLSPPARSLRLINHAAIALQLGIILFCGSLYAQALGAIRAVGMITPFGGLAFITGWILCALWAFKHRP